MTREIELTQGKVAIVDDIDYHWLNQVLWQYNNNGYAVTNLFGGRDAQPKSILMHRLIVFAPDTMTVDHRDLDGLHNWRSNLRIATMTQQMANIEKYKGMSRFKGVYRGSDGRKWVAQCRIGGRTTYLGRFADEVEAARVYNAAALKEFGEFARLNIIPGEET